MLFLQSLRKGICSQLLFSLESFVCLCRKDFLLIWLRYCVYIGLRESRLDFQTELIQLISFQVMVLLVISLSDARLLVEEKKETFKDQELRISFVRCLPVPPLFPTALLQPCWR